MNYYCFVAGLPEFSIDEVRLPVVLREFKEELKATLTKGDYGLVSRYFWRYDIKNLVRLLYPTGVGFDIRGELSQEELSAAWQALREEEESKLPSFFKSFYEKYVDGQLASALEAELMLTEAYFGEVCKTKNRLVSEWFRKELEVRNVLTAFAARNNKMKYKAVGEGTVQENLNKSAQRDFNLQGEVEDLDTLMAIASEENVFTREKKLDSYIDKWWEGRTFFEYFSAERIFAYTVRLDRTERWLQLDKKRGEERFRKIIKELTTLK